MNHYEAKIEARRERLEARAERLSAQASAAYKRADLSEEASGIPFGQPILVGHHSEGRHRAAIRRADNAMRKSVELSKAAGEAAARAASVGSGGISSDDPDAVAKLREKLAGLEADQKRMRDANAAIRKAKSDKPKTIASLIALGLPAGAAARLIEPDFCGRIGFADYQLSNNNANIKRVKDRIAVLERAAQAVDKKVEREDGIEIVEDVEANRLRLIFPGKPGPEVRASLKSFGFRWAPSEGAWQRHLSNAARWAAESVLKQIDKEA